MGVRVLCFLIVLHHHARHYKKREELLLELLAQLAFGEDRPSLRS